MKESAYDFEYFWDEFQPVLPLFAVVLIAQLIGATVGLWFGTHPLWFTNMWSGCAIASFPGYLLGLPAQLYFRPGSLSPNRRLILIIGLAALVMSVLGFVMPPCES